MKINCLSARVPLSKTYEEIAPGQFKEQSYPNTSRFTSIEREIDSVAALYNLCVAGAFEGLCLLKGLLDRPLSSESRAGHTDAAAETRWICLDVDYDVTDRSPEAFLDGLDPAFRGVSFLFQFSGSMGIKTHEGWRGHFFLILESPQSPQALKTWLTHLNLCTPLSMHVGLSASGGALTYPLDVTTCQNDKLLYITPPTCLGFKDPVEERFVLYERDKETLRLDLSDISAAKVEELKRKKIVSLRATAKLPTKTFKTTQHQGWEIMTNPDPVTVTGKKEERDFVYLNLNGGDSWAYYFPTSNPDVLFNFKGEPCVYMWDVDREIYNEYKKQKLDVNKSVPFGFLWPQDDQYYRGFANPVTKQLDWILTTGSKGKLKDFFVQNGIFPGNSWAVDEWDLRFDPTTEGYADFTEQAVNTYQASDFVLSATYSAASIPPMIDRVLSSVCVDQEVKEYFLNWVAHIFQTREKASTAWIFQGVQGTGKGVLFTHILSPLFGRQYCHEMTMDRLDDDFNAYLAENILLFIDEANIADSRNGDKLLNKIKNLITESKQHIRAMRTNAVLRDNYSNIILASNHDEIIPLEPTDRRFNVAPRQETPINIEYQDIVQIERELKAFANFLHSYEVNHQHIHQVLLTDARQRLIDVSKTTLDDFFGAIRTGDLSYFAQYLDNNVKADLDGIRYHDFDIVVKRWMSNVGTPCNISRNELRTCYQYLQNATISATKFNRMCRKYNIQSVPVRIDSTVTRGLLSHIWLMKDEELEMYKEEAKSNVVPITEKVGK